MSNVKLGINLEFVRHADKRFEWGVQKAAELGYEYVEPMVHWGRELLSEGVIDWARVIRICRKAKRNIVISVECGTIDQAAYSVEHLKKLL